jgi:hypothetical protein
MDQYAGVSMPAQGMRGSTIGALNRIIGSNKRHDLFKWMFGKTSSKELQPNEWMALFRWMDQQQIGGKWLPQQDFAIEVKTILMDSGKGIMTFD